MTIAAHVMVKNEYQFLWYSVMSVIYHIDKVYLWDTGSSDGTLEVIEELLKTDIGKEKIAFKSLSKESFSEEAVRQEMLDETHEDWFIVVDGDEIWWEDSINQVTSWIRKHGSKYESIIVPTVNVVGDMFHFQEESAGNYHLGGKIGHYNLRAINRTIPGLSSKGVHGVWGWVDNLGRQIQDRSLKKIKYLEAPYLHCTFLERAYTRHEDGQVLKRKQKLKHEIGLSFPKDYYYPEVIFRKRPDIVPSVWKNMNAYFIARSMIETPLRKFKRRYLPKKTGY